MREKIKETYTKVSDILSGIMQHHVGAYSAQSAFFFMFSLIPIILLLLTVVRYTPVTKADVLTAVLQIFPSSVESLITSIVNQVYNQSMAIVPVTILVALWAAGKGVMAITSGLNLTYDCKETRNYVVLRIRATLYTVLFLLMIILLLVLSVFGNSLTNFVSEYIPLVGNVIDFIVSISTFISPVLMVGFMLLVYRFLPNRKDTFLRQLPGSIFTAIGWMIISWIFSIYLDVFQGFSTMYGSMTTIVLIMLWLYFTMYIILLGGEVNVIVFDQIIPARRARNEAQAKDQIEEQTDAQGGEG